MDLTDFVKTVLVSVNNGVDEARKQTSRDIHFSYNQSARTVEFDVAVSAEQVSKANGRAGVKVLQFAEAGGDISREKTNSTISRVKFGVDIAPMTKDEAARAAAEAEAHNASLPNYFD